MNETNNWNCLKVSDECFYYALVSLNYICEHMTYSCIYVYVYVRTFVYLMHPHVVMQLCYVTFMIYVLCEFIVSRCRVG